MSIELLSPAGSMESLKAAITAGADAVYCGGSLFSARAYANNLDEEAMCRAIDYVHLHNAKLYMTVNTLLKDRELDSLAAYIEPYYKEGLNGVIIQDFGVFSLLRREFPDLPLHASTQMTLTGVPGAAMLKEMGAERIVPARELSLEEIREIKKNVDIEVECFIHGALCYCYSGQCLLSSMLGGRSGNRGRCAQPCRLPYRTDGVKKGEEYILSPKDICTVELVPQLIEAGIDSFKIEGRMKRPEYTAGVTSVYRKYIDRYLESGKKNYRVEKEDMELLNALYNRGGFSHSYYDIKNGRSMISLTRPNHFEENSKEALKEKKAYDALLNTLHKAYLESEKKELICGRLSLQAGVPSMLTVSARGKEITVFGAEPQIPQKAPMGEAMIRKQMEKTGATVFDWKDLMIDMEGDVFIPLQSLNELRREALSKMEEALSHDLSSRKVLFDKDKSEHAQNRKKVLLKEQDAGKPHLTAQVQSAEQLEVVLSIPEIAVVYTDQLLRDAPILAHEAGKKSVLVLPDIFRLEQNKKMEEQYEQICSAGYDGVLLRSPEELSYFKSKGYDGVMIADSNLYSFNKEAEKELKRLGCDLLTLPQELNAQELKERMTGEEEMVIYGYQPLMITANCIAKTTGNCRHQMGYQYLEDRYKKKFPVRRYCADCHNIIYNSAPLYLIDVMAESYGNKKIVSAKSLRLSFTIESKEETTQIVKEAVRVLANGMKPQLKMTEFTRGHYKRGVE